MARQTHKLAQAEKRIAELEAALSTLLNESAFWFITEENACGIYVHERPEYKQAKAIREKK